MPAEEEDGEDGVLGFGELENFWEGVRVFGGAGGKGGAGDELKGVERAESFFDLGLLEVEDGIARGGLVAGGLEGIESEGIVVGSSDFFFHEGSEDAELGGGELDVREVGRSGGFLVGVFVV